MQIWPKKIFHPTYYYTTYFSSDLIEKQKKKHSTCSFVACNGYDFVFFDK